MPDLMLPQLATIVAEHDETADTRTFALRLNDAEEHARFRFAPGQFLELSVFGVGEAPFCFASSPTRHDRIDVTVRSTGRLTRALHQLPAGAEVGVRGPCGNGFDMAQARGHDLLFVAGGIGLPPLRSVIWNVLDQRSDYGAVTILYGARTPADLVYKQELAEWAQHERVQVLTTVDRGDDGWTGHVGVVSTLFNEVDLRADKALAYVCGPPIMIRFVVEDLLRRGFAEERIISTLERMMQCGVGKCNHCCVGDKYLCRDGPVFNYRQIREMWE